MKHFLLITYFLLICVWGVALAQPLPETSAPLPVEAQEVLSQANFAASQALATYNVQFLDKPLWQDALSKGVQARDMAPNHPAPYRFLAEAYGHVNLYDSAWEAWEAYQQRGGTMDAQVRQEIAEIGDWLGYNSFSSGNYEGALRYYEVVVSLEPQREEALLNLGLSYLETGNREAALPVLQTLNETFPGNTLYQEYLTGAQNGAVSSVDAGTQFYDGIDLYYSGNIDQAWLAFSAAANSNPDYLDAFVWAGRTALELGQPEDAISYWQRATELDPGDDGAKYFLNVSIKRAEWGTAAYNAFEAGYNAYSSGDLSSARVSFEKAVAASPEYAEAWAWLGRVDFENGDFEGAYKAYDTARQLEPGVQAYSYFFQESGRRLGRATPQVEATVPPPNAPSPSEPSPTEPEPTATAPTPTAPTPTAPQEPVAATPAPSTAETEEPEVEPAPEPEIVELQPLEPPDVVASEPEEDSVAEEPVAEEPTAQEPTAEEPAEEPTLEAEPEEEAPTLAEPPAPPEPQAEAPRPAPSPEPAPEAGAATGGPPLTLLEADYSRSKSAVEANGAISFFEPSQNLQIDLKNPVNYAGGTLYQSLEVASAPSDAPVQVQVCFIPSDVSVKPACSSGGVPISGAGSYQANQALTSFSRYETMDWSQGIKGIMIILRDENGVPLDLDFALEGGNLELYYPIELSYEAVLVPAGGSFAGF